MSDAEANLVTGLVLWGAFVIACIVGYFMGARDERRVLERRGWGHDTRGGKGR